MVSRDTGVDAKYVEAAMRKRNAASEEPGQDWEDGDPGPVQPTRSASFRTETELLRVVLANDVRLVDVEVSVDLFANAETRDGYERVAPLLDGIEPGAPPDLGRAFGSDDSGVAELLRTLAMDARPIPDPEDVVNRLEVARIDAEIESVRSSLQLIDQAADEQGYSDLWQRLIALEQEKRDRRSDR